MRIAVTGASGNVGTPLVSQLLDSPDVTEVVGVARRPPADDDRARVRWVRADVAADDLTEAFRGCDVVVHLAWLLQPAHSPDVMRRTNVLGTERVLAAVAAAGVPALVHASSVGAYAAGPNDPPVTEDHPTTGIDASVYSRHKAAAERLLDAFERDHPAVRVVRLRPGIVLQRQAASALARYFLGPWVPRSLVRRRLVPVVPAVPGLAVQALHAEDMAAAYVLACTRPVSGAFNVAAEPVLDPPTLARLLGARTLPVPVALLRGLVDVTWRLHLQPTDAGWVDIGIRGPVMDTTRARTVLGWTPRHDAGEALLETLDGMKDGAGGPSAVLAPDSLPRRVADAARALVPGAGGTG